MQMPPAPAVGAAALGVMWERGRADLHQKRRKVAHSCAAIMLNKTGVCVGGVFGVYPTHPTT